MASYVRHARLAAFYLCDELPIATRVYYNNVVVLLVALGAANSEPGLLQKAHYNQLSLPSLCVRVVAVVYTLVLHLY
jgi:hypothetical protein